MNQVITGLLSGLGGTAIGTTVVYVMLRQIMSDYAALKKRVEEQIEGRLKALERDAGSLRVDVATMAADVGRMVDPGEVKTKLDIVLRMLGDLDRKVDAMNDETIGQRKDIDRNREWLSNLHGKCRTRCANIEALQRDVAAGKGA